MIEPNSFVSQRSTNSLVCATTVMYLKCLKEYKWFYLIKN